jgi:hypothetical protein
MILPKIKMKIQVPSSHTISYVFPQYISGNTTCGCIHLMMADVSRNM